MRVTKNSLVTMAYTMQDDSDGDTIDSIPDDNPMEFQCGAGQMVPGFERGLMGLRAGEQKDFIVAAADAYGEYNRDLVKKVPRASLPVEVEVVPGMRIPMRSPEGVELVCRILQVESRQVVADFNHPLAGANLRISVNIVGVRNNN
jgi:FKBP-type peptidyl-prolyl cis-trans isomerase 2